MKILFLIDDFPPSILSGAGIVAYNLAKGLSKKGHRVFVITIAQDKSMEGREEYEKLEIFRIFSNYHPRWRTYSSLYNPKTIFKVKKIIKEIKPDISHFHHIHQHLSYYCFKIAKKYSKAVFLTAHDVMLFNYGKLMPKNDNYFYRVSIWDHIKAAQKRYNPFRNIIIRHYLKYIDKIFAVSNALKKLLEINDIKNTKTIYNGIDISDWQIDKTKVEEFKKKYKLFNKKILIFTARLIEAKGGDELIKALALVNKNFSNFILLVVGRKWAYTEKMEKITEKLGIGDKIVFTDFLKQNQIKTAYNSADISISPSICFESFGMANLEAMACKKPVISSYFGGPKEVVIDPAHGGAGVQTGYLVNPNNVELMAEKILDLLKNPQKAKQFGEAGYRRAKDQFFLSKQLEKTLEYYQKFISSDD